jgi:tRNA threonylcarbamoyl adenosine modification protein YeaZ
VSAPAIRWAPDGVYLALETSGPIGSVALARGEEVLSRAFLLKAGEQSAALVPAIQRVLTEAKLPKTALVGVVVGAGPGSFTGVRIAAATAKGLTHALGLPLWAFSSLAAGALSDLVLPLGAGPRGWWEEPRGEATAVRWVLFDARGDRVYAGCFRASERALEQLVPGHPTTVGALLERPPEEGVAFAGDGAVRHRARIAESGHPVLGPPAGVPTADALIRLLVLRPDEPPVSDVARWEPEYLKASSAERERAGALHGRA